MGRLLGHKLGGCDQSWNDTAEKCVKDLVSGPVLVRDSRKGCQVRTCLEEVLCFLLSHLHL